jgi:hypothetical protein
MGSSSILGALAAGPAAPQIANPVDIAGKVAGIQQQRAQTAGIQAGIGQTQAQTQGINIENALKQRTLDAQQALVGLLKDHTTTLKDGTTATDMPSVLGKYRTMYPDKALELEHSVLQNQEQRTTVAKNSFELQAAQQKNLGFALGTAGFGDASSANDPQIAQKYAAVYEKAQQNGTAHLLPTDPQTFASNPQAWIPKLRDQATQSGAMADAAEQKAKLIDINQKQLEQGRTMFAQGMQQVKSPQDYANLVDSVSKAIPPDIFHAMGIAPPNTVNTPQAIDEAKKSAALTQMSPSERAKLVEENRHNTATEYAQRLTAAAEQSRASTAAGELGIKRAEFQQEFGVPAQGGGGGGVSAGPPPAAGAPVGGGAPVAPPSGPAVSQRPALGQTPQAPGQAAAAPPVAQQPAQTTGKLPILQVQGKPLDLNGNSPQARAWQSEPSPVVRSMAMNLLSGQGGTGGGGMGGIGSLALKNRAQELASKIDPQFALHAKAREDLYSSETAQKSILAANTSIEHSGQLVRDIDRIGTGQIPILNRVKLEALAQSGSENLAPLEAVRQQYVAEIKKYFDGGAFTESEYNRALGNLGPAQNPKALKKAILETNEMLMGGLQQRDTLINDNNNGAILGQRIPILTEQAKQVLRDQKLIAPKVGQIVRTKDGKLRRVTSNDPSNPKFFQSVIVPEGTR